MRSDVEVKWLERAECRKPGIDPEIFYPSPSKPSDQLPALAVCAACAVREQCRARTLRIDQEAGPSKIFGISGGLVEAERVRRYKAARNLHRRFPVCTGGCGRRVFAESQSNFAPEGAVLMRSGGMCARCWNKSQKESRGRGERD